MTRTNESQITYKILTLSGSNWEEQARTTDMGAARRTAGSLISSKKFKTVKVDKDFVDYKNGRLVSATIIRKDINAASPVSIYLLLAIAGVCGLFSFVMTLYLTGSGF